MKALITGHKGFIGTQLNRLLEEHHWEVVGIDLKDSRDVATPGQLDDFKDVTHVFHLAAHPVAVSPNTIDATYAVIDYVKRTGAHLVFASSAAVYHPHTSVYGAQKTLCETLIRKALEPQDYTILRLFNVIGHDGHGVVDKFIRSHVQKEPLRVYGSGQQRRDYVHVNDVVQAMREVAESECGGTYDIGTGHSFSVNQILEFFPGAKSVRDIGSVGVMDSVAVLNPNLPWYPVELNGTPASLEDYIELELNNYGTT